MEHEERHARVEGARADVGGNERQRRLHTPDPLSPTGGVRARLRRRAECAAICITRGWMILFAKFLGISKWWNWAGRGWGSENRGTTSSGGAGGGGRGGGGGGGRRGGGGGVVVGADDAADFGGEALADLFCLVRGDRGRGR